MHGSKLLIPGVTTTSKGSNSSGLLHLRPLQKPFKRRKDWTNCQTYIAAWNPGLKRNFKKMKSKLTISVPSSLAFKCPLLASRFCSRKVYTKYIALYKFLCITNNLPQPGSFSTSQVSAIAALPPPQCTSQNAIHRTILQCTLNAFSQCAPQCNIKCNPSASQNAIHRTIFDCTLNAI